MKYVHNIYVAFILCGAVISANSGDFCDIHEARYATCAAIIKDTVRVAEQEYVHALRNGGAYESKKTFSTWVQQESSVGLWYKALYSVHIATNNHVRFADGSIKPGFEIVLEEQRSERVPPCNTGVWVPEHGCPRHQLSSELFKLPLDMSATGQKVIQLDAETECELLVCKSDANDLNCAVQKKFVIRRAIPVPKNMLLNNLQ